MEILKYVELNPSNIPTLLTSSQGCGNPVCVVIDSKPRRFQSVCKFIEFIEGTDRDKMMHFLQKGDCYDISIAVCSLILILLTPIFQLTVKEHWKSRGQETSIIAMNATRMIFAAGQSQ